SYTHPADIPICVAHLLYILWAAKQTLLIVATESVSTNASFRRGCLVYRPGVLTFRLDSELIRRASILCVAGKHRKKERL
ncbi:AGAP012557-PA, partial [Anopheles gambiae str. PEST]